MPFWKCFSCFYFPTEDSNITELDYSNGTLKNVPPDVSQFERTLEHLSLSSNRISDLPPELFYCQELRVLKVNDNELEIIPNAIGSLRQLQILDLSRNVLNNIPENIKSCKNLTHLDLSLNNLQRLPEAITSLITLQELLLNETYLEFLPANFGRLVNLKILELRSNNLVTLPKSMSRLTELIRIDIGANDFTELPEVIGQLTNLRELWIDYNRIRRIPSNISNLRELVHFEATNNQLTSLTNEISSWHNLEVLSLSVNDLGALPFSIGMLKRLVTLKCDSNQLKELPDSICHLEQLEELFINQNYIVKLPSTIGLLRKIKFLIGDENLLRKLPNEISSCTNLSVISFRGNKLTELPHDIGHLKNLKVLNIVDNLIRSLPVSVLNLSNLSAFWISDNQSQPLVPLQFVDNVTKTDLTCFMLPQTGINRAPDSNTETQNDEDNGGWYQEVQMNSTSPSRRICFADETNEKQNDTITTRLLRSPTPYPKELRQMAKFAVRNSALTLSPQGQSLSNHYGTNVNSHSQKSPSPVNSTQLSTNSSAINHHIKEAKVLQNSQVLIPAQSNHALLQPIALNSHIPSSTPSLSLKESCDNFTKVQFYSIEAGALINNSNKNMQTYTNGSILTPVNSCLNSLAELRLPYEKSYEPFDLLNKENNDYLEGELYKVDNQLESKIDRLPHMFSPHLDISAYQEFHSNYYHQLNTLRNESNSPNEYHLRQQFQGQSPPQRPQEPPPYHIAKAYTKKSRQDLLTYDSIRNQNNSVEFLNNMNSCNSNAICNSHVLKTTLPLNSDSIATNPPEPRSGVSNANFENSINGNVTIDKMSPENGNGVYDGEDEVDQHVDVSQFDGEKNDSTLYEYYIQRISPDKLNQSFIKQKTPSSSSWLFGLHRNPTVKQVTLRKDPILGFEIKEITNQGIFVSTTMPNTVANELLRVDDKILDVDGVDFSKINHHDAQQILIDSGPILNIMISRT